MNDQVPIPRRRKPRIALYSHDTLGYGHFRRNILIANSLSKLVAAPDILLLAGMREAGRFDLPQGTDLVSLPAYSKHADGTYSARHLGMGLAELASMRAEIILATLRGFDPDLLIIDNVPRGAQNELEPVLRHLRKTGGTRVILGLRDVIDDAEKTRRQWAAQKNFLAIEEWFDEVWIYGSDQFYDLIKEYEMGAVFSKKARFTGYLNRKHAVDASHARRICDDILDGDTRPYILAMVGGGADGSALAESFARAKLPDGKRGILVLGSQMPASEAARVAEIGTSNPDLTVTGFLPETMPLIEGAEKIIAMGGYNSICEVLSHKKPALIVPRVAPRSEQLIRAEHLARAGLIEMLHPALLSPQTLGEWMEKTVTATRLPKAIDMNGLEKITLFATQALSQPVYTDRRAETELTL